MHTKNTVERNWLYDEVWLKPLTRIASDLGVTNVELKKVCDAMEIPTPPSGHWTKVEFGKPVTRPSLPAPGKDTRTSWEVGSPLKESKKLKQNSPRKLSKPEANVIVIKDTGLPGELHPLVKSTCAQLREDKRNLEWHNRKIRRQLNCQISESVIERVGLILDSFVRACEAAGYHFRSDLDGKTLPKRSVHTSPYDRPKEPSGVCWIEADGEKISFFLREKNKRVYLPENEQSWWKKYDEVASGMLECQIGDEYSYRGRTNWRDGKVQKLESLIPDMVSEIPLIAKAKKLERERQARRERRRQYENQLWNFEQRRKGLYEESIKKLVQHAMEHQTANVARQFFEAVKAELCSQETTDQADANMNVWIKWAELAISSMDPIQSKSPPWQHESFLAMLKNLSLDPPTPPTDCDEND